jgi:hypothetical protein
MRMERRRRKSLGRGEGELDFGLGGNRMERSLKK